MRITRQMIFTIFVFGLSLFYAEQMQAATNTYVITSEAGTSLLTEASTNGDITRKLKQGSRIELLEQTGDWLMVAYEDSTGYIQTAHAKRLEIDLLAAYQYYATILEEYWNNDYYTLFYDFTRDGLEELYLVETVDDGFRHRMFSGREVLFDETILKESLHIHWDEDNYYIVNSYNWFTDIQNFVPSELGITSSHEFIQIEPYKEDIYIKSAGNLALNETNATLKRLLPVGFETKGNYFSFDDTVDMIPIDYQIDGRRIAAEQWESIAYPYKNVPNTLELFLDGHASRPESNYYEITEQLYAAYIKYSDTKVQHLLDQTDIERITSYLNYLITTKPIIDLRTGAVDYLAFFYMAGYQTDYTDFTEPAEGKETQYYYLKADINYWSYKNFGFTMDDARLEAQIAEDAIERGYLDIEILEDAYKVLGNWGDPPFVAPVVVNQYPLEDNFIALQYTEGFVPPLAAILGDANYLIVKKVNGANQVFYPYIALVESLEDLDYSALASYAENLAVVQDNQAIPQVLEVAYTYEEEKTGSTLPKIVLILSLLIVISLIIGITRKKKRINI